MIPDRADKDSRRTLAAIGVLVACVSAAGHEALGHGGACLVAGGTVTLLTATHFACAGGNIWVDAAGPGMNLLLALVGFGGLRFRPARPGVWIFLFMLGGVNCCWLAGEILLSPFVPNYDEAAIVRQLGWSVARARLWLILGGIALYYGTVRYAARVLFDADPLWLTRRNYRIVHGAATLSFVLAGLSWGRQPIAAGLECFLTMGVAVAPLWFAFDRAELAIRWPGRPIGLSRAWIAAGCVGYVLFVMLQGRGIGALS